MSNHKIAVDDDSVVVEIGDNGAKIRLSISDTSFQRRLADMSEWFLRAADRQKAISERQKTLTIRNEGYFDAIRERCDISDEAAAQLETLLGKGSCEEIFGTDSPDFVCVSIVLEQIRDIVEDMSAQRSELVKRYSRHRGDV